MNDIICRLREQYPPGSKIRILEDIDDPYTPKKAGDVMTVFYIDDAGQIHGAWESGGSMSLVYDVDVFRAL